MCYLLLDRPARPRFQMKTTQLCQLTTHRPHIAYTYLISALVQVRALDWELNWDDKRNKRHPTLFGAGLKYQDTLRDESAHTERQKEEGGGESQLLSFRLSPECFADPCRRGEMEVEGIHSCPPPGLGFFSRWATTSWWRLGQSSLTRPER